MKDHHRTDNSVGGVGEDIHEGKRTIMVIHCLCNAPIEEANRLREILAMGTEDRELIQEAIAILKKNQSIQFAQNKAKELIMEAWNELDGFLPTSSAKDKLRALVDFMIERDT